MNKQEIIRDIEQLKDLEQDWDSYGASPPNDVAIKNAIEIINFFAKKDIPSENKWAARADVEGGVWIVLINAISKSFVSIECDNDGNICLVQESIYTTLSLDQENLEKAYDIIKKFYKQSEEFINGQVGTSR